MEQPLLYTVYYMYIYIYVQYHPLKCHYVNPMNIPHMYKSHSINMSMIECHTVDGKNPAAPKRMIETLQCGTPQ